MSVSSDLDALRILRTVVELGSMARAARMLGRSQQAISARMRTLEATAGIRLLVRGIHGTVPTEAGSLVLAWSAELLEAADRMEAGVRSLSATTAIRLRLVASQTIAESLLPGWLTRLRRVEESAGMLPTVVDFRVANSAEGTALVRDGRYELGLIETPRLPADVVTQPLGDDELVMVAAPRHPWVFRSDPVTLAEAAETPLVMREPGSGTRDAFADVLAAADPPLSARAEVELGSTAAVRSAIADGVAPGVLSRLAVRDDLVLGRLLMVVLDAPPLLRPLTAIHRAHHRLSDGARRLIEVARDDLSQTSPAQRRHPIDHQNVRDGSSRH